MLKVRLFYMDGKDLEVNIASKDSENFFENIGKNRFYFDESKGRGFWTDIEKIRHIVVEELPDGSGESAVRAAPCKGDGANKEGNKEPKSEAEPQEPNIKCGDSGACGEQKGVEDGNNMEPREEESK